MASERRVPATFILVRPRNPLNIGAAARALANFGFEDLIGVDPYEPVWKEARSALAGKGVLARAKALPLQEALAGATLILGTSDGRRVQRHPVIPLPGAADYIARHLAPGGRVAVLFGPEKTGLTSRELQHCRALVRIPTAAAAPSMNLGQAVALVAYELARAALPKAESALALDLPTAEQREDLLEKIAAATHVLDYAKNAPPAVIKERLRRMLARLDLSRQDAAFFQAVFGRVARLK